jgi:hypothetical protein
MRLFDAGDLAIITTPARLSSLQEALAQTKSNSDHNEEK